MKINIDQMLIYATIAAVANNIKENYAYIVSKHTAQTFRPYNAVETYYFSWYELQWKTK